MVILFKKQLSILFLLTSLLSCTTEDPNNRSSDVSMIDGQLPEISPNPLLNLDLNWMRKVYLFKQAQQTALLIENNNGTLIHIQNDGTMKTLFNNMYLSKKEIMHLERHEDALNSENLIYINPSSNTLEAITPTNQHLLIAGKDNSLTDSIEYFINNEVVKNKTMPLKEAIFNLPTDITEIKKNEWVILDHAGKQLRLISQDHIISDLALPSSLKIKGIQSNKDGDIWLYNDTSVFQYNVTQQKITNQWLDQFNDISDISISSLGTFVVDHGTYSIKKLKNGRFENFYQSICNAEYEAKHDGKCNPIQNQHDDTLRFSPLRLLAHPEKNELMVSSYSNIYTLSLTGKLERFVGTKTLNIDKTDQDIANSMQGCTEIYTNTDGIYCNTTMDGINFYKNGNAPRQFFDNRVYGSFIIKDHFIYSTRFSTITQSPLTNKIENPEQWYNNTVWFDEKSKTELDENMQPRSIIGSSVSLTMDEQGNVIIPDTDGYRLLKISPDKKVTTLISFLDSNKIPMINTHDEACLCKEKYNKKPELVSVKGHLGYVVDGYHNIYKIDLNSKSYTTLYSANKDTPSFNTITIDQNNNPWLLDDSHQHIYTIQNGQLIDLYQKIIDQGYPKRIGIQSIAFNTNGDLLLGSNVALFKVSTPLIH